MDNRQYYKQIVEIKQKELEAYSKSPNPSATIIAMLLGEVEDAQSNMNHYSQNTLRLEGEAVALWRKAYVAAQEAAGAVIVNPENFDSVKFDFLMSKFNAAQRSFEKFMVENFGVNE